MVSVNQVIRDLGFDEDMMIKDQIDPKWKRRDKLFAHRFRQWREREEARLADETGHRLRKAYEDFSK